MLIGDLRVDSPLVLGPMAGVTDQPFRVLAKEMGCGLVYSEMVSDKALTYRNERTFEMLRIAPAERPIAIQLFGADPDTMAEAARIVAEFHPEIIDINMGCPVPKVIKNGEGSALLKDLNRAAKIVEAVVKVVRCPVTVKMRSGWSPDQIVAPKLAAMVEQAGAAAVAVHGRTRDQFYSGQADWKVIRDVKERVSIPVIGNGDVESPEAVDRILQETGCDGIMVARAALGRPWLFKILGHYLKTGEVIPEPTIHERFQLMKRHLQAQLAWSGDERGVLEMRKHLGWYFRGLPDAARMRDQVNQITTPEALYKLLQDYELYAISKLMAF